ncbi:MAG: hypothetical protein ACYSWU_22675 [Planctomycetota bacterium]|jgi:hypothetical protein
MIRNLERPRVKILGRVLAGFTTFALSMTVQVVLVWAAMPRMGGPFFQRVYLPGLLIVAAFRPAERGMSILETCLVAIVVGMVLYSLVLGIGAGLYPRPLLSLLRFLRASRTTPL